MAKLTTDKAADLKAKKKKLELRIAKAKDVISDAKTILKKLETKAAMIEYQLMTGLTKPTVTNIAFRVKDDEVMEVRQDNNPVGGFSRVSLGPFEVFVVEIYEEYSDVEIWNDKRVFYEKDVKAGVQKLLDEYKITR